MSSSSTSTDIKKVAVIGATGKLGRSAVVQLSSLGIPVKCLVRNYKESMLSDETSPSIEPSASSLQVAKYLNTLPNVELIEGDVTNPESVNTLLEGCSSCLALFGARRSTKLSDFLPWTNPEDNDLSHSKQVNYQGVKNIIDAARKQQCKRIIRITGKGEDPFSIFSILINLFGSMAKAWNYEGEQVLRSCTDIDYTIIRPGVMKSDESDKKETDDMAVLALADNGGSLPVSAVSYEQIASLCIECLQYPNTKRCTLCAMNVKPGEGEKTYGPLLSQVKPDTKTFRTDLLKQHYLAVRLGALFLLGLGSGFISLTSLLIKSFLFK